MKKILIFTKKKSEFSNLVESLNNEFGNEINIEFIENIKSADTADLLLFDCNNIDELFLSNVDTILVADKNIVTTKLLLKIKQLGYLDYIFNSTNKKYYSTVADKFRRYLFSSQTFENTNSSRLALDFK